MVRVPYTYDDAVMQTDGTPMPVPYEALVVLSDVQVCTCQPAPVYACHRVPAAAAA